MIKPIFIALNILYATLLLTPSSEAMTGYQAGLLEIQRTWAQIKYRTPKAARRGAYASLLNKSKAFQRRYPDSAGAMLWSAVVLNHYAGEVRGIEALGMVKQAYRMLQRVEKIDPKVSGGLIYTALGQLYNKVPGWPIAFGDDAKAEAYLRKGVTFNPGGLDANYFLGAYLLQKKHYRQAIQHLRRAIRAPDRAQRPVADTQRKADALKLLRRAKNKLQQQPGKR